MTAKASGANRRDTVNQSIAALVKVVCEILDMLFSL